MKPELLGFLCGTGNKICSGPAKSDKMDLIIQKAVELGVYEIVPVVTGER